MKMSFTTIACPDWTLEQIAKNARGMGYDGVQLCVDRADGKHIHPDMSIQEARAVGALFRSESVEIMGLWGFTRFMHADSSKFAENQAEMRKLLALAEAMNAKTIRTYGGAIPTGVDPEVMKDKMAGTLRPLANEAHERGIQIGLYVYDDWASGKSQHDMIQRVGSPGLGSIYDTYPAFTFSGEPWHVTYNQIKDHLCYTLLSDGYFGADNLHHYVFLGAGNLPMREVVEGLKAGGYGKFLSFKWQKKWDESLIGPEHVLPHVLHWTRKIWNRGNIDYGINKAGAEIIRGVYNDAR